MEFTGYLPPDEFWAMNDRLDQEVRNGAARLPLFSIDGWDGALSLGSWQLDGGEGGVVHGDAFTHAGPLVEVITTTEDPSELARNRWTATAGIPQSMEILQGLQAGFAALPGKALSISVDGAPTNFMLWSRRGSWVAAGRFAGFGIVIDAQCHFPQTVAMSLTHMPDAEPLLDARRAALKALRGEAEEDA